MSHSGMTSSISFGLCAITGSFYPLISPLLGAIGTFVTGSDTSANILFGGLQVEAAKSLSKGLSLWNCAANTAGATAGKNDFTTKYSYSYICYRAYWSRRENFQLYTEVLFRICNYTWFNRIFW